MKTRVLIFAAFVVSLGVQAASASKPPKYPLEVSVFTTKSTPGTHGLTGTGKATVKEGDSYTGVDFSYDCAIAFMAYGFDRPYPAAWKDKGKVLALRVTKIADPDVRSECDLQVTMLPTVYTEKGGKLASVTPAEFHKAAKELEARERDAGRPGQAMPLRVYLVDSQWSAMNSLRSGAGKGNVIEKGRTTGFMFEGTCSAMALRKTTSSGFVGRWGRSEKGHDNDKDKDKDKDEDKEKGAKLVIAAPAPGDSEAPSCELNVKLQQVVYMKDGEGNIKEIPLAEYNKRK